MIKNFKKKTNNLFKNNIRIFKKTIKNIIQKLKKQYYYQKLKVIMTMINKNKIILYFLKIDKIIICSFFHFDTDSNIFIKFKIYYKLILNNSL